MSIVITNNPYLEKCLNNSVVGSELHRAMQRFVDEAVKDINFTFNSIIIVLRAALPFGIRLFEIYGYPVGIVSASRNEDLSIEIGYKNIPELINPLIVDPWVATGSTIIAVAKELKIKDIRLFCLIATEQALNRIKPLHCVTGHISKELTQKNYIVPPNGFEPRDGGDDLFINSIGK